MWQQLLELVLNRELVISFIKIKLFAKYFMYFIRHFRLLIRWTR